MMLGSWEYLVAWFRAFLFTEAVEVPTYMLLSLLALRVRVSSTEPRIRFAAAFTASAITHPAVWFIFPTLGMHRGWSFNGMVVMAELFAWLAEACFLRAVVKVRALDAMLIALAANAASVALGEATREITFRLLGTSYP